MDEFLRTFTDAYLEAVDNDLNASNMEKLNGYQHALLAHRFFQGEINEGGFVQLIQNGYGSYLFDNPTAKAWRLFGAAKLSKLLYKAKEIYDKHRAELERETTDEQFMEMYVEFEQFDDLEEEFFLIEEEETSAIARFVDEHLADFAEIV
ncbi:MAG TPA: hypothetical protein DDZ96_09865 [Porphyromonadaceae bacterium]|nr:hypothetical protein [Porphyromonadaceae bacterium]